jgi:hypothetical protein
MQPETSALTPLAAITILFAKKDCKRPKALLRLESVDLCSFISF